MKNDENNNLDDLMKTATEKVNESEGTKNNDDNNGSTKKIILFTVLGLFLFFAALAVGAFMLNDNEEFVDESVTPEWVQEEKKEVVEEEEEYDQWEFERPIELKEWAHEPFRKDSFWEKEGIEDTILEVSKTDYRNFYNSISWLNSGLDHGYDDENIVGPYTNDPMKRFLEDGEENPEFSYALTEDYEKAYVLYIERLLNPSFGAWSMIQMSPDGEREVKDERGYNAFRDMFTEEWWEANTTDSADYTNLPILAEWEIGAWDDLKLSDPVTGIRGVFYGEVNESEDNIIQAETIGTDGEGQQIIKTTTPVKYTAFGEDGDLVELTGTLEFTLQSNENSIDVRSRVVINDASLTLD